MARRSPKGLETRKKIMEAALDLFAAKGYAAVGVEDIAEAAGTTKGAVYYWFTDKDDLGRDLQHELYERLTGRALQALERDGDPVTNMRRAFDVYLDALGSLGQARFFLRDAWTIPELDEGGRIDHSSAAEMVRDLLAPAIRAGQIVAVDADALSRVLLGAWAEATLYVLTTGRRDETVAVVEHLIESLRPAAAGRAARRTEPRRTKE